MSRLIKPKITDKKLNLTAAIWSIIVFWISGAIVTTIYQIQKMEEPFLIRAIPIILSILVYHHWDKIRPILNKIMKF